MENREPTNRDIASLVTEHHGEVRARLAEIESRQGLSKIEAEKRFDNLEDRMATFERQITAIEKDTPRHDEVAGMVQDALAGVRLVVMDALASEEYKSKRDKAIKETIQAEMVGYYAVLKTMKTVRAAVIWLLPMLSILSILISLWSRG
jgi:hypothetical protein